MTAVVRGVCLALMLATAGAAGADRVVLHNGEVFEDVVAERGGERVVIRLAYGRIDLPAAMIARIEESDSVLQEYLARRESLLERQDATAGDWLALALWADRHDLEHGARQSARRAAELEPSLDRLAPLMRRFGFVLDAGLWVEYERYRPPPPPAPEPAPAAPERSSTTVEESLARAVEALARAQAPPPAPREPQTRTLVPYLPYAPVVAVAPWVLPVAVPAEPPRTGTAVPPRDSVLLRELVRRQPGSLLPFPRPGHGSLGPRTRGR